MNDGVTNGDERGSRDGLFVATLAYLAFPVVVFFLGWLRPWLGLAFAALTTAGVADAWRRARHGAGRFSRRQIALALALALFWAVASGIGGINPQSTDYSKHNLVFHDLVTNDWPVVYDTAPKESILTYYLAYYLPASAAAKVVGPELVDKLSLMWAWFGVALAFLWFQRLRPSGGTAVLFLILFIDGFCWLPGLLRLAPHLGWITPATGPDTGIDPAISINFWQFPGPWTRLLFGSEIDNLRWVPQHVIAMWLATACVLRSLLQGRSARHLVLVHAVLVLWSPFIAVGLIPFTSAALLRNRDDVVTWPNLAGMVIAAPTAMYFLGHYPQQYLGILFAAFRTAGDWVKYLAFLLLAIGLLFAVVWAIKRSYDLPSDRVWRLAVLAALVAVASTMVHMGRYNDWAMRTSMPAMFVLRFTLAVAAVDLWQSKARRLHRFALAFLLLLSAERTVKAWVLIPIGRAGGTTAAASVFGTSPENVSLAALPRTPEWDYAGQYLGSSASLFARYLMATGTSSNPSASHPDRPARP